MYLDSILETNKDKERFKTIKEFPNYLVSNMGYVINKTTGKELKPHLKYWYGIEHRTVALYSYGRRFETTISKLVALAFVPNPYNHKKVYHKSKNCENDKWYNLKWDN